MIKATFIGLFSSVILASIVACGDASEPNTTIEQNLMPSPEGINDPLPPSSLIESTEPSKRLGIAQWRSVPESNGFSIVEGLDAEGLAQVRIRVEPKPGSIAELSLVDDQGHQLELSTPEQVKPYFDAAFEDVLRGAEGSGSLKPQSEQSTQDVVACCWSTGYVGYIAVYGGGVCNIYYVASPCTGFWDCTTAASFLGCTTWI